MGEREDLGVDDGEGAQEKGQVGIAQGSGRGEGVGEGKGPHRVGGGWMHW